MDVLCSTALQQRPELFRLVLTAREALCLLPFQPPHSSVTKKPFPCKPQLLASLRTTVKPFFPPSHSSPYPSARSHLQAPDPNSKSQFRRRPSRRADSVLFHHGPVQSRIRSRSSSFHHGRLQRVWGVRRGECRDQTSELGDCKLFYHSQVNQMAHLPLRKISNMTRATGCRFRQLRDLGEAGARVRGLGRRPEPQLEPPGLGDPPRHIRSIPSQVPTALRLLEEVRRPRIQHLRPRVCGNGEQPALLDRIDVC